MDDNHFINITKLKKQKLVAYQSFFFFFFPPPPVFVISENWKIFQKMAKLVHFTLETKKWVLEVISGEVTSSLIHNKTSQF